MEYAILGPLTVASNGDVVALGPAKHRTLLAVLLLHANEVVSSDRLIDELWGEDPPPSAPKLVQVYVSQLRKALPGGGEAIRTRPPGYLLHVDPDQVDACRFEALVARARSLAESGEMDAAVAVYDSALSLWQGSVLADVVFESFAAMEKDRLEELRLAAISERTDCELALGRHERVVGVLEALVAEHPLRERLRAQLMLALYRSGRQADALSAYRDGRRALVEEIGIEPSRELRSLEGAILRHDPALELPHSPGPSPEAPAASAPRSDDGTQAIDERTGALRRRLLPAAAIVTVLLAAAATATILVHDESPRLLESRSLGRIDPRTNRIVGEVLLGAAPVRMAGHGGALWIAGREGTLSRLDPRRGRVDATLALGTELSGLAAGREGVWVGDGRRVAVLRVDPRHAVVASRLRIPGPVDRPGGASLTGPLGPSVAVGGGSVWVSSGQLTIRRIDPRRNRVRAVVEPSSGANEALAYGEGALWAGGRNAIARVSPSTGALTSTIRLPASPAVVVAGEDSVWVAPQRLGDLVRIDARTEAVTTIPLGAPPVALAVGSGAVWVADATHAEVLRIDPRSNRVVARIPTGSTPTALAVSPGAVWVAVT